MPSAWTASVPGSDHPALAYFEEYGDAFAYVRKAGLPEETVEFILSETPRALFPELYMR